MSFDALGRAAVEAEKKKQDEKKREEKAFNSADHTLRRQQKLPPTQGEINRMRKVQQEASKVNFKTYDQREIQRLKRQCRKFKEYAGFKERLKHFKLPLESAGGEEWEETLQDMRSELGQSKAHERFNKMWGYGLLAVEFASIKWPELFMGANLTGPVSLRDIGTSPEFLESIDDERAEMVIVHDWLFSSSVYSRLAERLFEVIQATGQQNALITAQQHAAAKFGQKQNPQSQ